MSTGQFMSFPAEVLNGSQKFEIVNLLGLAARFALPGTPAGNALERDLESRFSGLSTIGLPDAINVLAGAGAKLSPLDSALAAIATGDTETLHQALQQGNDAGQMQLLAINNAASLVELVEHEDSSLAQALWSKPVGCLLLRGGYSKDASYAYYAASLPGDSRRVVQLTWESVVAAGISAAVAILPPPKPVDMDRVAQGVHIMTQALTTATQAHADVLDALGLLPQAAQ